MANKLTGGKAYVGALAVGAGSIYGGASDHMYIENRNTDGKTIRINSRNFTRTSDSIIGFQSKPAANADGTVTVYGCEISPRFQDDVGGNTLVGIVAAPILKGNAGNLTGDVRGIDAELTDDNQAGRTVAGMGMFLRMRHQLHCTITGGLYGIRAETSGGTVGWSGLIYADEEANLAAKETGGGAALPANVGWLRVRVGDTHHKIPLYND